MWKSPYHMTKLQVQRMNKPGNKLVVCMGVSGSGKSTLGRAIAGQLNWQFIEADDFHSHLNRQRMAAGQPLDDTMRAPWLASIINKLTELQRADQCAVLAFSGLRTQHRQALRNELGDRLVFLNLVVNKAALNQRLQDRRGHFMPASLLQTQFDALQGTALESDVHTLNGEQNVTSLTTNAISLINKAFVFND